MILSPSNAWLASFILRFRRLLQVLSVGVKLQEHLYSRINTHTRQHTNVL